MMTANVVWTTAGAGEVQEEGTQKDHRFLLIVKTKQEEQRVRCHRDSICDEAEAARLVDSQQQTLP